MTQHVPNGMRGQPWSDIQQEDIDSVRNNEKLTYQAVFMLLHEVVKLANETAGFYEVALLHTGFVSEWIDRQETLRTNPDPADFTFFADSSNTKYVVPVLLEDHYYIIYGVKSAFRSEILVADSADMRMLEKTVLRQIFGNIDRSFKQADVQFLNSSQIKLQKTFDFVNCGVYSVMNAERLIRSEQNQIPIWMDCSDIMASRLRFVQMLENTLGTSTEMGDRRIKVYRTIKKFAQIRFFWCCLFFAYTCLFLFWVSPNLNLGIFLVACVPAFMIFALQFESIEFKVIDFMLEDVIVE